VKIKPIILILIIPLLAGIRSGTAERVHHWIDSKGGVHLSQEPPPADGKLIEIMEYPVDKNKLVPSDPVQTGTSPPNRFANDSVDSMTDFGRRTQAKKDMATSCYLAAEFDDVYVYVIEYTDPDQVLDRVLYQGYIPKYQKQIVESSSGAIKYSYRQLSDDRTYGDNRAECVNGREISIP
jgi:hypothetical protein